MRRHFWGAIGLAFLAACGGSDAGDNSDASFAPKVSPDDFSVLVGDEWEGSLTYLDYSDEETETTIPAELLVGQNGRTFELYFSFPEDPRADGRAEVAISENGRKVNDETVQRRVQRGDELMLVTKQDCQDNAVTATCEYTYTIAPQEFTITKMVTPRDEDEAFRRNHYSFTRS
ncbi:MAG: hypothetical protein RIB03_05665 [Henriciella sp.]|uniref:hypothetical protein n=1 Tax=Henriciella sp. TaxID=1968823 RepID=UPI00261311CC|nr:hypothetical protein [Henriciella sp.]